MKFKDKDVTAHTLQELKAADWELQGVEDKYLEALQHPRLQAMKPKPEMNPSFQALRKEIKNQISKFDKAGLYIEKED